MFKLKITIENDLLFQLQGMFSSLAAAEGFPQTKKAMEVAANDIAETWRNYATGSGEIKGVEPLKNPSSAYAKSIREESYGPFSYAVFSDAKIAETIENGQDELDMKKTHPYGNRSRVTKSGPNKGVPYLIIPFRWGTPKTVGFRNVLPQSVYNIVKNKKDFVQTETLASTHKEKNIAGDEIERREYQSANGNRSWGSRLKASMNDQMSKNMEGLSSMLGQIEGGIKRTSGYFTFRIISAASPAGSWIRPRVEGKPVVRNLEEMFRESVSDRIDAALKGDLGL